MFGKKTFLEPHIEEWALETWTWLSRHLGGQAALDQRQLVLPTGAFFPRIEVQGHERALVVFKRVKRYIGLESWDCELVMQESRAPLMLHPAFGEQKSGGPAGTFISADGSFVITYDPGLIDRPFALISTFAHECSHYILHQINEPPPGADEEPMLEELATDLNVAFQGFGVFGANAAFEFQQFQSGSVQGWSSSRLGYITEDTWVFALALFLSLRGERPDDARHTLKPHLAKRLDKAVARLARDPNLLAALE